MTVVEKPAAELPGSASGARARLCPRCRATWPEGTTLCAVEGTTLIANHAGLELDGRYHIDRFLGVGGMEATVWRAIHTATGREVAVKLMPMHGRPEEQRFDRGARISSRLNHPHITTVHDFGHTGSGLAYLVMELLEGQSLAQLLKRGKPDLRTALHIADQLLRALEHAHKHGVVHRDLKPSNLFLTTKNDDPCFLKVLDFGIAKQIDSFEDDDGGDGITRDHQVCGTPEYISPEQVRSQPTDARSDLYSLGVVLYRLFTGQLPFGSKEWAMAYFAHVHEPVPPFPPDAHVPAAIEQVVRRALEKRPEDRFADAAEMRMALRGAVHAAAPELGMTMTGMFTSTGSFSPSIVGGVRPGAVRGQVAKVIAGVAVFALFFALGAWLITGPAAPAPAAPVAAAAPEVTPPPAPAAVEVPPPPPVVAPAAPPAAAPPKPEPVKAAAPPEAEARASADGQGAAHPARAQTRGGRPPACRRADPQRAPPAGRAHAAPAG